MVKIARGMVVTGIAVGLIGLIWFWTGCTTTSFRGRLKTQP